MDLELVRELLELDQPRRLRVANREANRRAQHRKVELDLLDDSGPPHLGDDLLPRGEQPAVRLRDRGGGERLRVEADEGVLAEVLPEHGLDLREGDGRDGVDEVAELLDVDVRQEIRPRREKLPELDERRAELLEAAAKRLRSLARRFAPAGPRRSRQGCAAVRFGVRPARRSKRAERARDVRPRGRHATVGDLGNAGAGRACRFPGRARRPPPSLIP